uniref:Uncharacterized protein n=1 Tax=Arundo donax TaxID=35708 RepID=A0A0A9E9N3_ARUDO
MRRTVKSAPQSIWYALVYLFLLLCMYLMLMSSLTYMYICDQGKIYR